MKNSDFRKLPTGHAGVHDFYRKDLSAFALDVGWQALKAYELSVISQALTLRAKPRYRPVVPKAGRCREDGWRDDKDAAIMAWNKVIRRSRRALSVRVFRRSDHQPPPAGMGDGRKLRQRTVQPVRGA